MRPSIRQEPPAGPVALNGFLSGIVSGADREKLRETICSTTAFYNCPEPELGSQLTDPPNLDYVRAYWSSASHDFVPFLIDVKNKYDPDDVFWGAQTIPLALT